MPVIVRKHSKLMSMRSKKSQLHPPIPDGGETEMMKTLDKPNFTPVVLKPSFKTNAKKKSPSTRKERNLTVQEIRVMHISLKNKKRQTSGATD